MPRSLVVLTQSALCAALLLSTSPVQAQSLRLIAPDHPNTPLQVEVGEIVRVQVLADFESLDAAGLAAYVTVPQDAFEVRPVRGNPGDTLPRKTRVTTRTRTRGERERNCLVTCSRLHELAPSEPCVHATTGRCATPRPRAEVPALTSCPHNSDGSASS